MRRGKKVVVLDDSLRRNRATRVTPTMRLDARREGRPLPTNVNFLLHYDRQGRKVQDVVTTAYEYEGTHLRHAILRAARWMRHVRAQRPPRHVAKAMVAFQKAHPKAFKERFDVWSRACLVTQT